MGAGRNPLHQRKGEETQTGVTVVKVTPLSSLRLCPVVQLYSSGSDGWVGYLPQGGLMAPSPRGPVSQIIISEDFLDSFRLSKEIHLTMVSLLVGASLLRNTSALQSC